MNTNTNNHIGETRMMNCGMKATIIAYRTCNDIDVQFEDKTIVTQKSYSNFKKGGIKNPNITSYRHKISETRMMNCGMKATIITYRNANSIDIQFEDGTIVTNKQLRMFKRGEIEHPMFKYPQKIQVSQKPFDKKRHLYEVCINGERQLMYSDEIVEYTKKRYSKNIKTNRIGETKMMNCGMKATIINYPNAKHIDVQFEDGTIINDRRYEEFINGKISNIPRKEIPNHHIGETRMMNCGMKATIINCSAINDIDVQFEDGTIVTNKIYKNFQKGNIKNPNAKIGMTRLMNCGMIATIITYRSSQDIDIQFGDKTIVEHKSYSNFLKGKIKHPEF